MRRFVVIATVVALLLGGFLLVKTNDPNEIRFVLLRDAIPAITDPTFTDRDALSPGTLVIGVARDGEAKAYPIPVLSVHEIVNDHLAGEPIAVTYCPLCGSSVVYERTVGDRVLTFRVSGKLLRNDLVMFDAETGTLWAQLTGEGLTGPLAGAQLALVSSRTAPWSAWKEAYPDTKLLEFPGSPARYATDPYGGYAESPDTLLPVANPDDRLPPKAFVYGIEVNGATKAYPYETLRGEPVVNDVVGGVPIVVAWSNGVVAAFERGDRTFVATDAVSMVNGTGGTFSRITGEALDGGANLTEVPGVPAYWFAWHDFHTDTEIYGPLSVPGARGGGSVIGTPILFTAILAIVMALLAWDLMAHVRNRSGWADPKWRTWTGTAFWGVLGLAFAGWLLADAREALSPAYRIGQAAFAYGIAALAAYSLGESWFLAPYAARNARVPAAVAADRIARGLDSVELVFTADDPAPRPWRPALLRRFVLLDGGSVAVDTEGRVLVRRGADGNTVALLKDVASRTLAAPAGNR